jgi:hypothetical protein
MGTYIQYELEDGSTILLATDEEGVVQAGAGDVIKKSQKRFEEALKAVKPSIAALYRQLRDMEAEEVQVAFGLKAMGEAGNFAIGKLGVEANYQVTLKWSNKPGDSRQGALGAQ